jgi:colicin import membrane protein
MSAVLEQEPQVIPKALPIPPEMMAEIGSGRFLDEAKTYTIDSTEIAQYVADQRRELASQIDRIKALRTKHLAPLKEAVKNTEELFNPAIQDREAARELLGVKLLTWDQAEKKRIEAEKAEREAVARRLRQEAEARAAAEIARAEEQAKEQRRREQEALEAQRKAEADGNARSAAAAAAAAARAREAAEAAIENGNARAQSAQIQAVAAVSAIPEPEAVKIAGQSIKENWLAILNDRETEETALTKIVQAIVTENRSDLLALLKIDTSARGPLHRLAAAQKKLMRVPGYTARDVPSLAGSRK